MSWVGRLDWEVGGCHIASKKIVKGEVAVVLLHRRVAGKVMTSGSRGQKIFYWEVFHDGQQKGGFESDPARSRYALYSVGKNEVSFSDDMALGT